jgi:hypothetical protein
MVVFFDADAGLLQAVPKGSVRVYPFQTPDVGFRFVDIRTMNAIAQIRDWSTVEDATGTAWGIDFTDTLEKLCLFLDIDIAPADAIDILYSNSLSGLSASNVQNAIDELSINQEFTVELIDALTVDFYAPYDLKINTIDNVLNTPTITIQDDGAAYTLTNTILKGSKITVTADIASVVNLITTKA